MFTATKVVLVLILSLTLLAGCGGGDKAPVAQVRPHEMTIHGDTRVDNYFWLNDRQDPEVIAYLEAENAYLPMIGASKFNPASLIKKAAMKLPMSKNARKGKYPITCNNLLLLLLRLQLLLSSTIFFAKMIIL